MADTVGGEPSLGRTAPQAGMLAGNLGKPIRLSGVNMCGVAAEPAKPPGTAKVWTKLAITSDESSFHRIVEGLCLAINHHVQQVGAAVNLGRADMVLLVIQPDNTAELWVDTAAVSLAIIAKRELVAGRAVFENDIADVLGMSFPLVQIGAKDRIVCLFRQDWRFALYFNFNPDGDLSLDEMTRTLGTLHRTLRYRHLYDTVADEAVFGRLLSAGWFPFVEIIGPEFRELANCCEAGFDLADVEAKLIEKFKGERIDRLLARWISKPHLAPKETLLRSAVHSFKAHDPVPAIKIMLTEIEGALAEAYRAVYGTGAKLNTLLAFAITSAEKKAGRPDTLFLPAAFSRYLETCTFANFDPEGPPGNAGSRHAVGHGLADPETYTEARALQALLSFDQLAFFT